MTHLSKITLPTVFIISLVGLIPLGQSLSRNSRVEADLPMLRPTDTEPNTLAPVAGGEIRDQPKVRPSYHTKNTNLTPAMQIEKQVAMVSELKAAGKTKAEIRSIISPMPVLEGSGSISGTVYEGDGTTALPSVSLWLYNEYGIWVDYESTDDYGWYQFEMLGAGNYIIQVRENPYVYVYYENAVDPIDATPVLVVDDQATNSVNFILTKRPQIMGYIFEEDGATPIVNRRAIVSWIPEGLSYGFAFYENWSWYERVDVDENGQYQFGIDPMEIRLSMNMPGYVGEYFENTTDINSALLLNITTETDTLKHINFSIPLLISADDGYEPNNIWEDAYALSYGDTAHAVIDPAWDADVYTFYGSVGDTVIIVVEAHVIGSDLDSYLYLLDSSGTDIIELNDDFDISSGWDPDARIEEAILPYDGTYFVRVCNYYESGGPDHFYNLSLDKGARPVPDDPYEPNNDETEAYEIAYGDSVSGLIMPDGDQDVFRFTGQEGDTISIKVLTDALGSQLEPFLKLLDSDHSTLASEAIYFGYLDPSIINFILPAAGTYYIEIAAYPWEGGKYHFYSLILERESIPTGAIAGTVYDSEGQLLPIPVELSVYPDDHYYPIAIDTVQTADAGTFVIDGLLPGDYTILANPQNSDVTDYATYYYNNKNYSYQADLITVVANETVNDIDFVTEIESYIRGVISFPENYPYRDSHFPRVVLYDLDLPGNEERMEELNFASGFEIGPLLPGSYKLAILDLYSSLPAVYYGGGYGFNDGNTTTIVLEPGDIVDASIALSPGIGSISGTIYVFEDSVLTQHIGYIEAYDSSGHFIQITKTGQDPRTGSKLDDGSYLLEGLNTGNIYLRFLTRTDSQGVEFWVNMWYPNVSLNIHDEYIDDFYVTSIPEGALPLQITSQTPIHESVDFNMDGVVISTRDRGIEGLHRDFALHQNYPNPFNPTTRLEFDLPQQVDVSLMVYDIMGRQVTTVVNETMVAGYHRVMWDGRSDSGQLLPSGIYFARLVTPEYSKVRKMLLLK